MLDPGEGVTVGVAAAVEAKPQINDHADGGRGVRGSVGAEASVEGVRTGAALESVGAPAPVEEVGTAPPFQVVRPLEPPQAVRARVARDGVVSEAPLHVFEPGEGVRAVPGSGARGEVDRDSGHHLVGRDGAVLEEGRGVAPRPAFEGVVPSTAVHGVVANTAVEGVAAAEAVEGVVPAAPLYVVPGRGAPDAVGRAGADEVLVAGDGARDPVPVRITAVHPPGHEVDRRPGTGRIEKLQGVDALAAGEGLSADAHVEGGPLVRGTHCVRVSRSHPRGAGDGRGS